MKDHHNDANLLEISPLRWISNVCSPWVTSRTLTFGFVFASWNVHFRCENCSSLRFVWLVLLHFLPNTLPPLISISAVFFSFHFLPTYWLRRRKKTQQHLNFLFDFYALPATPNKRRLRAGRAERKWDSEEKEKKLQRELETLLTSPHYQCFLHTKLYNFCSQLAAFSHDFHPKFESPTGDRLRGIVHMIDGWTKKKKSQHNTE